MDKNFNGKIRCIKAGSDTFKIWEVYEIKNGELLLKDNVVFKKGIKSLDDIKHLASKFELVKEPDFKKILEHIENVIQEFSYLEEKTTKQKLQEIINYFGEDNQKLKAIEELSELTIAIIDAKNDKTENLIEEIADVEIMIRQLKMIYKIDKAEVKKAKQLKIERTLKMIEEA